MSELVQLMTCVPTDFVEAVGPSCCAKPSYLVQLHKHGVLPVLLAPRHHGKLHGYHRVICIGTYGIFQ